MKTLPLYIIITLALAAPAINAAELTKSFKAEVRAGQMAAMLDVGLPLDVVRGLMAKQKFVDGHSKAFQLGYAVDAMRWMLNFRAMMYRLGALDREQVEIGFTIYSSKVMMMQIELHLSNEQMAELFSKSIVKQMKVHAVFQPDPIE